MKAWLASVLAWFWRLIAPVPSWLVELLSGGLSVALACIITKNLVYDFIIATLFSLVYEAYLDANGLEYRDLRQRQAGIVLTVLLLWFLR